MICKNCKKEIDAKADMCIHCGSKVKKPIFKKWWFWVIIAVFAIVVIGNSGGGDSDVSMSDSTSSSGVEETITYELVDLQTMFDDLKNNAMKAEAAYNKKYIEFSGKIANFDSDGDYVGIEPKNADEWNFENAMCYIKNDEQKAFFVEKSVGDIVTIRGRVKSIGEVLGYSIDIAEVE